ncbi:hypothetical protein [Arthrobacter sp. A5]|uniref:hypothetical protein n=1 Tax=Arthrobacter sp. A5 TaxID=576926 RepID=UPI003DA82F90
MPGKEPGARPARNRRGARDAWFAVVRGIRALRAVPQPWDAKVRPTEVKLDRILQVSAADMRREGSVLNAQRFGRVADGLRRRHRWT